MLNLYLKNEITNSAEDVINRRISTPIYGSFIIYWCIFHWKFLVTLFLIDQDLILRGTGLMKQDYLKSLLFDFQHPYYSALIWILPAALTWLTIWHFPKWVLLPAFKKDEEYEANKLKIRIRLEKDLSEERTQLAQTEQKQLETEVENVEVRKKIEEVDPHVVWDKEYLDFENSTLYPKFTSIIDCIYQHRGYVETTYLTVPKEILAYAHSNNLVNFSDSVTIELTEKGKYFVAKYTQE